MARLICEAYVNVSTDLEPSNDDSFALYSDWPSSGKLPLGIVVESLPRTGMA